MSCDHKNVTVKLEDALNEEKDRLTVPLECQDCGETRSKEVEIDWKLDQKVNSTEDVDNCQHNTVLFNFNNFELIYEDGFDVDSFDAEMLVLGKCDDCEALLYDEVKIDLN